MTSLRRHLASLGLTMVVCHIVLQVLVPAALCCHQDAALAHRSGSHAAPAKECCPKGAHPGEVCPLHGAKRAVKKAATDCHADSQRDFRDLIIVLSNGGVISAPALLAVPTGSESAFGALDPQVILVAYVPLGPPPRV